MRGTIGVGTNAKDASKLLNLITPLKNSPQGGSKEDSVVFMGGLAMVDRVVN